MIKKLLNAEFLRYVIAGVIVTFANWLIYSAMISFLPNANWRVANFVSIFLSILLAYFLNRRFIFRSKNKIFPEILSFFVSRGLVSLVFEHGFMELMIGALHFNPVIKIANFRFQAIKVFAAVFVILGNYFVSKYIVFTNKINNKAEKKLNYE